MRTGRGGATCRVGSGDGMGCALLWGVMCVTRAGFAVRARLTAGVFLSFPGLADGRATGRRFERVALAFECDRAWLFFFFVDPRFNPHPPVQPASCG